MSLKSGSEISSSECGGAFAAGHDIGSAKQITILPRLETELLSDLVPVLFGHLGYNGAGEVFRSAAVTGPEESRN